MSHDVHAVTGAFGYSGRHVAERLLARGARVRTLTGHPDRPDPFGGRVEVARLAFDDPPSLRRALEGVSVLYNTYWVRFARGDATHARAVANSRALFRAAADAGVGRIVHVSITNPSPESRLPYFSGKAEVERALVDTGIPHTVVRPAVFFGGRDVLVNNIAWLLRRSPLFGIPRGRYGLRPIHVEDFARLAVERGHAQGSDVVDAVGPETLGYEELVRMIARAVGSRAAIVPMPRWAILLASRVIGRALGDVPLTADEVDGLAADLLVTRGPPTGETRFSAWLEANADGLGRAWANELARHYR
jgi:NADH dehydrogenase